MAVGACSPAGDCPVSKAVSKLKVIVVGGGIGGLAAAIALRRVGADVEVYEQTAELREVGAGIQISPNASRLLLRAGLGAQLEHYCTRPLSIVMRRWRDGSVLSQQPLAEASEASFGAPYYHIYRPDLLALLAEAVPDEAVRMDHRCVEVVQDGEGVEARFANGTRARGDLLVGADGIHSAVRAILFGADARRYSGTLAYRARVPVERIAELRIGRDMNAWLGPGRHVIHYYMARGRYLNFAAVVPAQESALESWTAEATVDEVMAEFADWHPQVRGIIAQAQHINRWGLYDRDPLGRWSSGRVTLLGDAAHAMLPFMAQGAVQGIEDAFVLARALEQAGGDIGQALARYDAVRIPRVTEVQTRARQNGINYHLPDGEAQRERDARLAQAAGTAPLLASGWLYGYDGEAALA